MIPLRNVPFKVICVLGLGAADFPRQDTGQALDRIHADLLADRARVGDRSTREDDRYLFLQTLMAARQCLYLSWTGMDARKGTDLEPSVLLDELLDTVCTGYFRKPDQARQALRVRHPLQPFSARLFDGVDPRLFTYRPAWQPAAARRAGSTVPPPFVDVALTTPKETPERIALADLGRFLSAPQQFFLQHRAALALSEVEAEAPDREPLTSDARAQSRMRQALFDTVCALPDAGADVIWQALRARALLPPLALGREQFETCWNEIEPQARRWRQHVERGLRPGASFELQLDKDVILQGRHPDITADGQVAGWVGGERSAGRWIRWWAALLALRAEQDTGQGIAFGASGKQVVLPLRLALPDAAAARLLLLELVDLYRRGLREPLALLARPGWVFVQAGGEQDKDKAWDKARKEWNRILERGGWEALALRGRDPLSAEGDGTAFRDQALSVYGPLWQAVCQGDMP